MVGYNVIQVFMVVIQVILQVVRVALAHSIADASQREEEGRDRQCDGHAAPNVGPNNTVKGTSHACKQWGGEFLLLFMGCNPLLFSMVISSTLMMGVLLIARLGLHPAFLGGDSIGRRGVWGRILSEGGAGI